MQKTPEQLQQEIDAAREKVQDAEYVLQTILNEKAALEMDAEQKKQLEKEARQREALTVLTQKKDQAKALLKECEAIAREHQLYFSLGLGHGEYFNGDPNEGYVGWQNSTSNC